MARENFLWGAPRIHGELLMLGFTLSQATVSRYMPPANRRPGQSWRTFIRNQILVFRHEQDWIVPLTEAHLQKTLRSWLAHYNRGRPHSSLGPGLPDPPPNSLVRMQRHRHRFDRPSRIVAHSVLNGLHHEYGLLPRAARLS
jgi:hypothetical protein